MRKMKFSLIADAKKRKATFSKRKKGMFKKLDELVTLCDIQACAVVHSPYDSNPVEAWPSTEGVEEVVSMFRECSVKDQTKKMVDQEAFLRQRIDKEEAQAQKLHDQNRDLENRETMWRCLRGEIDLHQFSEGGLQDLSSVIDKYLNKLNDRIEDLTKNGESSSSSLPPHQP